MFKSIYHDVLVTTEVIKDADNETLTGVGVDMLGYEGVAFYVCALEGEALAFSIKAQQDDASNFGTAADITGTAVAFTTTIPLKGHALLDLFHPTARYVRPIITVPNADTATPVVCIAMRYKPRVSPVVGNTPGEFHVEAIAGTA